MKTIAAVIGTFLLFVCAAHAEESFTAFGSTVSYARPDPAQWKLVRNGMVKNSKAYLLMYERNPIKDSEGRNVRPVIAIVCEMVPDTLDVIRYSISKRGQTPFKVNELLTPQDGSFSYGNSVGFEGGYKKIVEHKILVGHMRHGKVGLQVICDSSEEVFNQVEEDMRNFLRSITFKD